MDNDMVIALGMFRINSSKTSKEEKQVPKTVRASARTKPITISQPTVITKKDVNSDLNGLSSTGVDNTKTRRPQPRSNTKNDRVPSASKSSRSKNKEAEVIQICLWCVDSCCSKHMIGNLKLLINFIWKFMGTVRFGNDHVAAILGFDDIQWGNILITRVYFVEGLGHNLFFVGQFCDSDLEVAFRRNACFVRNLEGVDLLKGDRSINLYTINLHEMASASSICLMARATSTKSWLWHQRLSHLNFDTINDLSRNDLVLEAARTMLIFSRAPLFLWAEAIATACFTQNRSIIHRELDLLFEAMYDDYIGGQPSATDVDELNSNAMVDRNTFVNPFANSSTSAAESLSSQNVDPSNMHTFYQPYPHEFQWTKDHPLEQNIKEAMTDPAWIDSMQEELLQFKRLDVRVLVPAPDNISPLTLKWLFKNKHDEE
nr:integrase, catalytic region, zinc finger, CCHC-type, peptidase aspartic, catalytic [Tanacetum cinerariifolium]